MPARDITAMTESERNLLVMAELKSFMEQITESLKTLNKKVSGNGGGITSGMEYKVEHLCEEIDTLDVDIKDLTTRITHVESQMMKLIKDGKFGDDTTLSIGKWIKYRGSVVGLVVVVIIVGFIICKYKGWL